jgi:hypothetical protein
MFYVACYLLDFIIGVTVTSISPGDGKTFPKHGDELTMHYVSVRALLFALYILLTVTKSKKM